MADIAAAVDHPVVGAAAPMTTTSAPSVAESEPKGITTCYSYLTMQQTSRQYAHIPCTPHGHSIGTRRRRQVTLCHTRRAYTRLAHSILWRTSTGVYVVMASSCCRIYTHMSRPTQLPKEINYLLFRGDVKPLWEVRIIIMLLIISTIQTVDAGS